MKPAGVLAERMVVTGADWIASPLPKSHTSLAPPSVAGGLIPLQHGPRALMPTAFVGRHRSPRPRTPSREFSAGIRRVSVRLRSSRVAWHRD